MSYWNKLLSFLNKNDVYFFIKNIDWKLFFIIAITLIIPTIYRTTRVLFIGQINDGNNYSIASQIQWLNIIYEILTEAIIVPMFFTLSRIKSLLEKNNERDKQKAKTSFSFLTLIVFGLFLIFTIAIFFSLNSLVHNIGINNEQIINETLKYMRFETWAIFLTSVASFFIIACSILKLKLYWLMGIVVNLLYLITNVLIDLFIVSNHTFSLNLEYVGVGISSIVSSFVLLLGSIIYFLFKPTLMFSWSFKNNIVVLKQDLFIYFKNFLLAGLETLVRNLMFSLMILKMMANIGEQGTYWLANSFIWTWLLLPISIISLFIKETHNSRIIFKNKQKDLKYKICFYYSLTLITIIIWCCFIPLNPYFIENIMGVKTDYMKVANLVLLLLGFYVCYALSSVIDAIFIANGRMGLFLFQTLIVNLIVYPIFYICYQCGAWTPTLNTIALMFGLGLLFDFIIDVWLCWIIFKYNDPFKKISKNFKNIRFIKNTKLFNN